MGASDSAVHAGVAGPDEALAHRARNSVPGLTLPGPDAPRRSWNALRVMVDKELAMIAGMVVAFFAVLGTLLYVSVPAGANGMFSHAGVEDLTDSTISDFLKSNPYVFTKVGLSLRDAQPWPIDRQLPALEQHRGAFL